VLYYWGAIFQIAFSKKKNIVFAPIVKGLLLLCLTGTMLVAHFLLGDAFSMGEDMVWTLTLVHYVVPIGTILDWLLFDKKGLIKLYFPLLWLLAPVFYFVYAMLGSQIENGLVDMTRYPYPFLDIDVLGVNRVLFTSLIILGAFLVIGYIYFLIDKILSKIKR
jgi:hypothetical protein